jgi:N-sulfoglucosamine sulfohydrolase
MKTKSLILQLVVLPLMIVVYGIEPAQAVDRPNILLIVSEDNGPDLGCYGNQYVKTPNLDELAAGGIRFNRAYVAQAGCSPSRASILTGLYPHQNGQIGLATWGFRLYSPDVHNVVRSLKSAGYRTGIIGKLHINPKSAFPFDMEEIPTSNFSRKKLGDYAKHAEAFFQDDEKPFFLSVNYPDAHKPWIHQAEGLPKQPVTADEVRPLSYMGVDTPQFRELNAGYYNSMSRLDVLVGDLLAALKRSGKSDNTLVIYLGDHGADFLRGKRTMYEGGLRIPFIVNWLGRVKSNQVLEELVSTVDLVPTMLAVAGAEPEEQLPGRSMLPLLLNESAEWRQYLFSEYHTHAATDNFYPQRGVHNQRYKLIENLLPDEVNPGYDFTNAFFDSAPAAIEASAPDIRDAYHLMRQPPRFELYDLQNDPYEFHNLAASAQHRAVMTELQKQLATWREQTRDPLLDADALQQLKQEVYSIKSKAESKKHDWSYSRYFFRK